MGVHGLWRLIEPSGKPVPLETLENKVLAVDVSIWLHQAVKGFQDSKGAPLPNAHLLGIYHRVCKLLYFKIKPIFVFDGGVPALKKQTIAKRNQAKSKNLSEADHIQKQLLNTLLKHTALNKVLSEKIEASFVSPPKPSCKNNKDDMFALPPVDLESTISTTDFSESDSETSDSSPSKHWDLHTVDVNSSHFKSLPLEIRHEILTDLKETRKQSSWGRLHELPKYSDDFSVYQMNRLLKRQAVQNAIEDAEKEMGGHTLSLAELELLLKDQGVINDQNVGHRIASDENTRYLFVKDVKKTVVDAQKEKLSTVEEQEEDILEKSTVDLNLKQKNKADEEFEKDMEKAIALSLQNFDSSDSEPNSSLETVDEDLQKAVAMSLQEQPSTSKKIPQVSFSDEQSDSSSEEEEIRDKNTLSSAHNYMMEYSGLTPAEIAKIIGSNRTAPKENRRKIENEATRKFDEIETISTSSDSSDLIEVTNKSELTTNLLEITVNPQKELNLDDDLFGDIFGEKNEERNEATVTASTTVDKIEILHDNLSKTVQKEGLGSGGVMQVSKQVTPSRDVMVNYTNSESSVDKEEIPQVTASRIEINDSVNLVIVEEHLKEEINKKNSFNLSEQEMREMKKNMEKEKDQLMIEKCTKERMASNITDQMYQEAQELLELFGVPYIVAPMEAEAQCAFLNEINLTDGTITDDSDIWLFGGKTVYKNFFNQSKHVMEFKAENIQHHFKLTREQMVLLALLVGSDYTVGIQGIGPVTALEVLAAFPPPKVSTQEIHLTHSQLISGLSEFRAWFKKGKTPGPGRTVLRSKLKNVSFTENFPSIQVVHAYLEPSVDTSNESFTWGKPNILSLTEFAREKFGWTKVKAEEILKPVIRKLEEKTTQKTIKDFFKTTHKTNLAVIGDKLSKRVKTAVNNIGKDPMEIAADEFKEKPKGRKHRRKIEENVKQTEENQTKNTKRRKKIEKNNDEITKSGYFTKLQDTQGSSSSFDEKILHKIQKIRSRRLPAPNPPSKPKKGKLSTKNTTNNNNKPEETKFLEKITDESKKRVEEIESEIKGQIERINKKPPLIRPQNREIIPQREKDKSDLLKNRIKAIEVFRKGKHGPGYVKKRVQKPRTAREDAGLSESSSDE